MFHDCVWIMPIIGIVCVVLTLDFYHVVQESNGDFTCNLGTDYYRLLFG
jgi:hypothetical protein